MKNKFILADLKKSYLKIPRWIRFFIIRPIAWVLAVAIIIIGFLPACVIVGSIAVVLKIIEEWKNYD